MVNNVVLLGRAGCDGNERIKELNEGIIAHISVATSERRKKKGSDETQEVTTWHNISCFGKTAEFVEKYVKKGDVLYIEGSIEVWKDKNDVDRVQIRARRVQGCGGGGKQDDRGGDRRDDRKDDRRDDRRSESRGGDNGGGGRDDNRGSDRKDDRRSESRGRDDRGGDRRGDGYKPASGDDDVPF